MAGQDGRPKRAVWTHPSTRDRAEPAAGRPAVAAQQLVFAALAREDRPDRVVRPVLGRVDGPAAVPVRAVLLLAVAVEVVTCGACWPSGRGKGSRPSSPRPCGRVSARWPR